MTDDFLADYEQHLLTAARALAGTPPRTARRARRVRLVPLAAGAATVTGIVAVLVALGWPSPSTTHTGSGEPSVGPLTADEKTLGLLPDSHPQVAGEGTSAQGRAWSLAAGREAANFCLSLVVDRPSGPYSAAQCGGMTPGTFGVSFNSGDEPGDPILFYGTAPDAARTVSITVGATEHRAPVFDDPLGIPGRLFVVEAPGYWRKMNTSRMTLLDRHDRPLTSAERTRALVRRSSPLNREDPTTGPQPSVP